MLGIGAIIGAGIFATIGTAAAGDADAARRRAGADPVVRPHGVACGFAALCYAEFAAMVPISGSAYTYSYATLGELVAWIIGWDLIIEYAVGNVAVAISWGNYFKTLRGRASASTSPPGSRPTTAPRRAFPGCSSSAPHLFGVPIVFNMLAFGIVALITIVLVIGIRESASINAGMVILKLIVLAFFVIVGWNYTRTGELARRSRPTAGRASRRARRSSSSPTSASTRSRPSPRKCANPKRDLPIGIIGSLVICTVIYVVVAPVFTGIIPYNVLVRSSRPSRPSR